MKLCKDCKHYHVYKYKPDPYGLGYLLPDLCTHQNNHFDPVNDAGLPIREFRINHCNVNNEPQYFEPK